MSGYGDPVGESSKQLGLALANKVDNDILTAAKTGTQKIKIDYTVDGLTDAKDIFMDEDDESVIVAIVSPKTASALRRDAIKNKIGSEVGANELISGTYADIDGIQIVRSRKLTDTEGILVKASEVSPALKLIKKRDVLVETDRDVIKKTTIMTGDQHYAAYLYDDTKIVNMTFEKPVTPPDETKPPEGTKSVAAAIEEVEPEEKTTKAVVPVIEEVDAEPKEKTTKTAKK